MFHLKSRWCQPDFLIPSFLVILSAVLAWHFHALRPLADWDEGIYSNIVGEILQNHTWGHFTLQGTPWFDKEPLGFWLMAFSVKLWGFNLWALRFPALLASLSIAPLWYALARLRVKPWLAGSGAALFLVSPVLWHNHMLGTADFESLTLALSLATVLTYFHTRATRWWFSSALFLAALFLTRGIWGFPFLLLLVASEIIRPYFKLDRWSWSKIISVSGGALIPWLIWHVSQYLQNPDLYVQIYWRAQFVERVVGQVDAHGGPITYYVHFLQILLRTPTLILFGVSAAWLKWFAWQKRDWFLAVLVLWLGATIIPPHVLSTKLNWYILPAMPVLYLVITMSVNELLQIEKKLARVSLAVIIFLASVTAGRSIVVLTQAPAPQPIIAESFLNYADTIIPIHSTLAVYQLAPWNLDKILPATYWQLHFAHQWQPVRVDVANQTALMTAGTWWLLPPNALRELEQHPSFKGCTKMFQNKTLTLIKLTTDQHRCAQD